LTGKHSLTDLTHKFPEDIQNVVSNLWLEYHVVSREAAKAASKLGKNIDDMLLDKEKMLIKRRVEESAKFRQEQQFAELCKAARSGDATAIALLARQVPCCLLLETFYC
jgi:hypothetical protein